MNRPLEVLRGAVIAIRERLAAVTCQSERTLTARHHPARVGGFGGDGLRPHPVLRGRRAFLSPVLPRGLLRRLGHEDRSALLQRLRR